MKICFLQEPVAIWESIKDNNHKNIIEHFYEDNERYSFAFQMMAYISRLKLLKDALNENYDIIFTERSIYSDRNVFATMLYKSNKMNSIEYTIYNQWFDEFSSIIKNIKTIYIRTVPEICKLRIDIRSRKGENIELDYLKTCHYYHEIWLNRDKQHANTNTNINANTNANILIIDGNVETNTSQFIENKYFDEVIEKVYKFLNL